MKPWCLLLTGLPNSGKTTIAYHLTQAKIRNALIIDGDKHREMQFLGEKLGFSKKDIMKNNLHVIKMAQFAQCQGINVIISQIAPYVDQRQDMRNKLQNFYEVYCKCSDEERQNRPNFRHSELVYEHGSPDLIIDTGETTEQEAAKCVLKMWGK